jgi:hypothetical protein
MPFSLRRLFAPGSVELIVPYISVTTEGQVVIIGGVPNAVDHGHGHAASASSSAMMNSVTHSGLGDIILKGRYYAWEETRWLPAVDAIAKVKFPTASESKGLGTGAFDEGFDLEFTKTLRPRILALGDLGYTFIGNPSGFTLQNQWNYSVGGGYYVLPTTLLVSMTLEEYRAVVPGDPNPMDLLFEADYKVNARLRVDGGIQAGLTSTAADYGINLGAHWKF